MTAASHVNRDDRPKGVRTAEERGRPKMDEREKTGRAQGGGGERRTGGRGERGRPSAGGRRDGAPAGRGQTLHGRGRRRREPSGRPPEHGPRAGRGAVTGRSGRVRADGLGRGGRAVRVVEAGTRAAAAARLSEPRGREAVAPRPARARDRGPHGPAGGRSARGRRPRRAASGVACCRREDRGRAQAGRPAADAGPRPDGRQLGHAGRAVRATPRGRAPAGGQRGRTDRVPGDRARRSDRVRAAILPGRGRPRESRPSRRRGQARDQRECRRSGRAKVQYRF